MYSLFIVLPSKGLVENSQTRCEDDLLVAWKIRVLMAKAVHEKGTGKFLSYLGFGATAQSFEGQKWSL